MARAVGQKGVEPMHEDLAPYMEALLAGLIGVFASYLLGFSKEQRSRRREAKLAFASVLKIDLDYILKSRIDAREILAGRESTYEEAKDALRKHLLFWQRFGFDQAWDRFFYSPENKSLPFLEQYMDFGSLTKRKRCHELLNSRVGALLHYANVQP